MGGDPDECPDRYAVADPLSRSADVRLRSTNRLEIAWSWQLAHFHDLVDAGTEVVGSVGICVQTRPRYSEEARSGGVAQTVCFRGFGVRRVKTMVCPRALEVVCRRTSSRVTVTRSCCCAEPA